MKKIAYTIIPLILILVVTVFFLLELFSVNKTEAISTPIQLRKFPYPYRNMLSLLSDTDWSSKAEFEGMHRFMNTYADTDLGKGVGLDVGDTFWMGTVGEDNMEKTTPDPNNSRYWRYWWGTSKEEVYAKEIRKYIKSGWIDIPHTFFEEKDKSQFNREQALNVLEEWKKIGYHPLAWVDHASNPWDVMFYYKSSITKNVHVGEDQISIQNTTIQKKRFVVFRENRGKSTC
ncbi:hypothetical protein [Gordoniibacillus kamchatkensis]|uniref:hypothetical protein n=1 Tax=Gordoniibacillus kamchatkensis TaxID=1590651 RepID=UPI00069762A9|nr:hypothetical protein [Paenibacillus sp. VKM B-2647]